MYILKALIFKTDLGAIIGFAKTVRVLRRFWIREKPRSTYPMLKTHGVLGILSASGLSKPQPVCQIWLFACLINKALLEYNHVCGFTFCLWLFCVSAELNKSRDHMNSIAWSIYYLAFYTKGFANPSYIYVPLTTGLQDWSWANFFSRWGPKTPQS